MKPQEVITVITDRSVSDLADRASTIITYPELDQFFEKGMYIENIVQSCLDNGRCAVTFVFRYYNASQSKVN